MSPRLTFYGAAGQVTGSCTLVEIGDVRILVDFGLIQGTPEDEARNFAPLPIDVRWIDAVVVTHAHADHIGRLPLLDRWGYAGPIYCHHATAHLLDPVLQSSAHVQQIRARERLAQPLAVGVSGAPTRTSVSPTIAAQPDAHDPGVLFDEYDARRVCRLVRPIDYREKVELAPGVTMRLLDAGHVIGSASVELRGGSGASARTIVFSGDLGASTAPLLPTAASPLACDVLVLESTYGDRLHPQPRDTLNTLSTLIAEARADRGRILMPAFALGHAQQLVYRLGQLSRDGRLLGTKVYLDSRMAMTASEAYTRFADLLVPEVTKQIRGHHSPLYFPELYYISNRRDSRLLDRLRESAIIIAGSGFAQGGPIVDHLASNLWRPEARVLLMGYQPPGSPVAQLAAGAKQLTLGTRSVQVAAKIHSMAGFSGHADSADLERFVTGMKPLPGTIVLNHGDDGSRRALAQRLHTATSIECRMPGPGDTVVV